MTNGVVKVTDVFEKHPELHESFHALTSLHFLEIFDGTIRPTTNQIFSGVSEHVPCYVSVTLQTSDEDSVAGLKWFVGSMLQLKHQVKFESQVNLTLRYRADSCAASLALKDHIQSSAKFANYQCNFEAIMSTSAPSFQPIDE